MGKIIKFLNHDEIKKHNELIDDQYLVGFYRVNEDTVLYCSIVKDKDGFEYYYDCNRNVAESTCPDNSYQTYDECYSALLDKLDNYNLSLSWIGMNINRVTSNNLYMWNKICKIDEPYPVGGMILK